MMCDNEMMGELNLVMYTDPYDGEEYDIDVSDMSGIKHLDNDDEVELRYIVTKTITVKDLRKGAFKKNITVVEVIK